MLKKTLILAVSLIALGACKAQKVEISMTENDLQSAKSGQEEMVSFEAIFSSIGDLDDAQKAQVSAIEDILDNFLNSIKVLRSSIQDYMVSQLDPKIEGEGSQFITPDGGIGMSFVPGKEKVTVKTSDDDSKKSSKKKPAKKKAPAKKRATKKKAKKEE